MVTGILAGDFGARAGAWESDTGDATVDCEAFYVGAVAAFYGDEGGFGGEDAGTDDDTGNADEVRDVGGIEIAN